MHRSKTPFLALGERRNRESDDHQLDRIRMRLWRRDARDVSSDRCPRASFERGVQGCRETRDGIDRDHVRAGPGFIDSLGEEFA